MSGYSELVDLVRGAKKVAVAFSGGVDSSLVAKAAVDSGIETVAITVHSPLFSLREMRNALAVSEEVGVRHVMVKSSIMPENTDMRCYYCKKSMTRLLRETAEKEGFNMIADGVTVDDIDDVFRQGVDAASEERIWHPLVDVGFTTEDVVNAAKDAGLSIWDRPSNACLASRISYGEDITVEKLRMVEAAEEILDGLSKKIRVRLHNNVARIEVMPEDFERIFAHRKEIVEAFKKIGFVYVALDMAGYRSGSMNEEIQHLL